MNKIEFRQYIRKCANTGCSIILPTDLSRENCAIVMAEEAAKFIDEKQDIKAFILLNERRRLEI